jgi:hypothetical protein
MAPAPINVIGHNPITHAVEVRPQVSCGDGRSSHQAKAGSDQLADVGTASNPHEATDCTENISEIFAGAKRLPPRELPPDFQQRLLAAIESDEIWADEAPLFLRRDV